MLHAVLQKIRRIAAKFMPGLLLGAVLLGGYFLFDAFKSFGTEKQFQKIRGFHYAEKAMQQIGLSDLAGDAADIQLRGCDLSGRASGAGAEVAHSELR